MNKIIPYRSDLKTRAQTLRKTMTLAEKTLWERIRKKQLKVEFHRQIPMLDYIVDFYCHEIGLAIEVDGKIHDNQVLADGLRQGRIEEYGVHFLRFTNDEVIENIEAVIIAIEDRIGECM